MLGLVQKGGKENRKADHHTLLEKGSARGRPCPYSVEMMGESDKNKNGTNKRVGITNGKKA